MSRIVLAFMWLIHWLPFRALAGLGNGIGAIAFWLIPERRRVTRINLQKCFPELSASEREELARAHFRAFCRSVIERGVLWWAPRARIARLVHIDGMEHLPKGRKTIVFAPHFVGLDATLSRLSLDYRVA